MPRKDTTWQEELIALFLYVSEAYQRRLHQCCMRFSNNRHTHFSDEEVITLYLFGLIKHHYTVKAIYDYACDHLQTWFPALPSYVGFVNRLNRLGDTFAELGLQLSEQYQGHSQVSLVDSMPIVLAHGSRCDRARVAPELADIGYAASKRSFYWGVKLHVVASYSPGTLPQPQFLLLSAASHHDLAALHSILPKMRGGTLCGDKIYQDRTLQAHLAIQQNLQFVTPIMRKRNHPPLSKEQRSYNRNISQIRQPIESLIGWIQEKTRIQYASKVRSLKGLMVHVFGRLAAALYLLKFNS